MEHRTVERAGVVLRRGNTIFPTIRSPGQEWRGAWQEKVAVTSLLVWGAGAIGGTIGGFLARAGYDPLLVDTDSKHISAIRSRGLRIEGPIAQFVSEPRACLPTEVTGQFQTVLLCVKAQHTQSAVTELLPYVAADGYVVSMQNGLNERVISEELGADRTVGAFVNFGADCVAPGEIIYGGRGALVIGELDGRVSDRVVELQKMLRHFEEGVSVTGNIFGYLWGKLAYSSILFGTALSDLGMDVALASPQWTPLWHGLAAESLAVAAAEGIKPEGFNGFKPEAYLPGGTMAHRRASLDGMIAFRRTSTKQHSGMWRDMAVRNRKTEVDEQPGLIVQIGKKHGLECPLLKKLVSFVHEVESGARTRSPDNLTALAHLAGELGYESDTRPSLART